MREVDLDEESILSSNPDTWRSNRGLPTQITMTPPPTFHSTTVHGWNPNKDSASTSTPIDQTELTPFVPPSGAKRRSRRLANQDPDFTTAEDPESIIRQGKFQEIEKSKMAAAELGAIPKDSAQSRYTYADLANAHQAQLEFQHQLMAASQQQQQQNRGIPQGTLASLAGGQTTSAPEQSGPPPPTTTSSEKQVRFEQSHSDADGCFDVFSKAVTRLAPTDLDDRIAVLEAQRYNDCMTDVAESSSVVPSVNLDGGGDPDSSSDFSNVEISFKETRDRIKAMGKRYRLPTATLRSLSEELYAVLTDEQKNHLRQLDATIEQMHQLLSNLAHNMTTDSDFHMIKHDKDGVVKLDPDLRRQMDVFTKLIMEDQQAVEQFQFMMRKFMLCKERQKAYLRYYRVMRSSWTSDSISTVPSDPGRFADAKLDANILEVLERRLTTLYDRLHALHREAVLGDQSVDCFDNNLLAMEAVHEEMELSFAKISSMLYQHKLRERLKQEFPGVQEAVVARIQAVRGARQAFLDRQHDAQQNLAKAGTLCSNVVSAADRQHHELLQGVNELLASRSFSGRVGGPPSYPLGSPPPSTSGPGDPPLVVSSTTQPLVRDEIPVVSSNSGGASGLPTNSGGASVFPTNPGGASFIPPDSGGAPSVTAEFCRPSNFPPNPGVVSSGSGIAGGQRPQQEQTSTTFTGRVPFMATSAPSGDRPGHRPFSQTFGRSSGSQFRSSTQRPQATFYDPNIGYPSYQPRSPPLLPQGGLPMWPPTSRQRPQQAESTIVDLLTLRDNTVFDWNFIFSGQYDQYFVDRSRPPANRLEITELSPFSGERVTDWPAFKASIDTCLNMKLNLDWPQKMYYLIKGTKGFARSLIEDYPQTRQGYAQALWILQDEFGNFNKHKALLVEKIKSLPPLDKRDLEAVRNIRVTLRKIVLYASRSGCANPAVWAESLLPIINMDFKTRENWESYLERKDESPSLLHFETWCKRLISKLQENVERKHLVPVTVASKSNQRSTTTLLVQQSDSEDELEADSASASGDAVLLTETRDPCIFCSMENHGIAFCRRFRRARSAERRQFAMDNRLCFRCMKAGHAVADCTNNYRCSFCESQDHHSLLHPYQSGSSNTELLSTMKEILTVVRDLKVNKDNVETCLSTVPVSLRSTCFRVLTVEVAATRSFSDSVFVNAVLDEGSGASFVTSSLAKDLNLDISQEQTRNLHFLGTAVRINNAFIQSLFVRNVLTGDIFEVSVNTIESIPKGIKLPNFKALKDEFPNLAQLPLPDAKPVSKHVDILFGLDNYHLLSCLQELPFQLGEPCARKSPLGWTVSYTSSASGSSPVCLVHVDPVTPMSYTADLNTLDRMLLNYFDLERSLVEIKDVDILTAEEKHVQDLVQGSAVQLRDRHYMVKVPWKRDCPIYPQNREAVIRQQLNHVRALAKKNPEILTSVAAQFKDFHDLDWTEPLDPGDVASQDGFWLCWFVVTCLHKSTPHRIVFDCARRFLKICLNDGIHPGPKTQNDISMILLAFRFNPVAVAADVSKMYMQFKMYPEDRRFHRFVDEQGKWWQFKSHIFGNTASPYVCISTMMNHIRIHASAELFEKVRQCFYVDDLLVAFASVEDAKATIAELVHILSLAKLSLRKFVSNSPEFWSSLTEPLREKSFSLSNPDQVISALGLKWLPNLDVFTFSSSASCPGDLTKRKMASVVSSIYDPPGFLVAFTFVGAKILQDVHRLSKNEQLSISWDTVLSASLSPSFGPLIKRWQAFLADLGRLDSIRIRRLVTASMKNIIAIHIFSDGSDAAYAFLAYAVCSDNDEPMLIAGAKRLTSLSPRTIPEIELQGVCLGTKFADKLRLRFGLVNFHFWTDSLPVLYWLNNPHNKLKVFVTNRLIQVRRAVTNLTFQWHFVPGDVNPADKPTRGLTLDALAADHHYWHGPAFLVQSEEQWPTIPFVLIKDDLLGIEVTPVLFTLESPTYDKTAFTNLLATIFQWSLTSFEKASRQVDVAVSSITWAQGVRTFLDETRFSKIYKLVGTLARILQFLGNVHGLVHDHDSWQPAAWAGALKCAQLSSFEISIKAYIDKGSWPRTYGFAGLQAAFDSAGLIRVYGRWSADLTRLPENRNPVLLRADSLITILIADQAHRDLGHGCSIWELRSKLQERFHIIRIQPLCRMILSRCIPCQKKKRSASSQLMSAPHHDPSLWEVCRPFYIISMDFCGPFDVLNLEVLEKRHVLIIVCQQTKALFVEDCSSLDTNNLVSALSIFMSQMGTPGEIRTDNASCFLSGKDFATTEFLDHAQSSTDELRELLDLSVVEQFCKDNAIKKWTLSTPRAAHTNGLAERFVGLFKTALLRISHNRTPTMMEFRTLIKRCQDIVNSRPLVYSAAESVESSILLTPNHFLRARVFSDLDPQDPAASTSNLLARFYATDKIIDEFWTQFQTLMLQASHKFSKWTSTSPNVQLDQLVLIVDKDSKRAHWDLGKIVAISPSEDGLVRNVRVSVVKSANLSEDGFLSHIKKKEYDRHVTQLIPLDLCTVDEASGSYLLDLKRDVNSSL